MANIQERRDKNGKIVSYSIRVFRGRDASGKQLKPFTATFDVKPNWTENSARKKAETFAAQFEAECKAGTITDTRQKFQEYCDYVLDLKENRGTVKHSTLVRYKELTERIYPEIGHIKLKDLKTDMLNSLYSKLSENGVRSGTDKATARIDIAALLKKKGLSRSALATKSCVPSTTVCAAVRGEKITAHRAEQIAAALEKETSSLFIIEKDERPLSAKTVIEYHRLISTVLEQAVKEGLIPYNVASRCELPKLERKEVNYFQPEEIDAIRTALENEPIMWKTLTHLFLVSGARRGEILGLRWASVDYKKNRIYICNNIQYPEVVGSSPSPATTKTAVFVKKAAFFCTFWASLIPSNREKFNNNSTSFKKPLFRVWFSVPIHCQFVPQSTNIATEFRFPQIPCIQLNHSEVHQKKPLAMRQEMPCRFSPDH